MSDEVLRRLDELGQEIRKQGRAAIAAQAAAEACLESMAPRTDAWLLELMPVLDAMNRMREQARDLGNRAESVRRVPLVAAWPKDDVARLTSGIDLLCRELDDALERLGVTILEPSSGPVDAALHRVVETRPGTPAGHVVDLVRRGYVLGDRVVREADVVATKTDRRA